MTSNAFLFMWDCYGIESIIPITQYEQIDRENTLRVLAEKPQVSNPLGSIIHSLVIRATVNVERNYEIYAVDCEDPSMDEEFWWKQWKEQPQNCADVLRDRGHKIFSNRSPNQKDRVVK
jgi:hypothetical protein